MNKQIKEMAKDVCERCNDKGVCTLDNQPCDLICIKGEVIEALYNAGYRKQSEVAKEIFKEIGKLTCTNAEDWRVFEQLKKKYTEE